MFAALHWVFLKMGKKDGKTINPADKFRRQQRKKEKEKNKERRKLNREIASLNSNKTADRVEETLAKLEEAEKEGKLDTRLKQKKQKLKNDAVVLLKGKIATNAKEYEEAMTMEARKTMSELEQEVLERFPNPEESPYYHPTLNPFGAAPPGAAPLPVHRGLQATLMLENSVPAPQPLLLTGAEAIKEEEKPSIQPFKRIKREDDLEEIPVTDMDLSKIPLPPGSPPPLETDPLPPLPLAPPPLGEHQTKLPDALPHPPGILPPPPGILPPPPGILSPPPGILPGMIPPPPGIGIFLPPLPPRIQPQTQIPGPRLPNVPREMIPEYPEVDEEYVDPANVSLVPTSLRVKRPTPTLPNKPKPQPQPRTESTLPFERVDCQ